MTTWVELCCGGAAVSLRLVGGPAVVPPVPYMGGKRQYAGAILGAVGLHAGAGADRVVLCDAGPWGRAWAALVETGGPARVAAYLRAWHERGEQGAALFERIRAEGQDEQSEYGWTAQFLALQCGSAKGVPVRAEPGVNGPWRTSGYAHVAKGARLRGFVERLRPDLLAQRVERLGGAAWPARTIVYRGDARDLDPDAVGATHVYIDPPYVGTTGYEAQMDRDAVLMLARRWASSGAVVAVSEGEPLPIDGWHAVDVSALGAKGHARTFTKSRQEWITVNRCGAMAFDPPRSQLALPL